MDVERHSKHLSFARLAEETVASIVSVWLLAHQDTSKTQEAGGLQTISATVVRLVFTRAGIGGPVMEAVLDRIGCGINFVSAGARDRRSGCRTQVRLAICPPRASYLRHIAFRLRLRLALGGRPVFRTQKSRRDKARGRADVEVAKRQ